MLKTMLFKALDDYQNANTHLPEEYNLGVAWAIRQFKKTFVTSSVQDLIDDMQVKNGKLELGINKESAYELGYLNANRFILSYLESIQHQESAVSSLKA